jgi:hypothetical protein
MEPTAAASNGTSDIVIEATICKGPPHGPHRNPCHLDEARCSLCGRTRPHTIRRLNRERRPVLCDKCHSEEQPR